MLPSTATTTSSAPMPVAKSAMPPYRPLMQHLLGADANVHRLLLYWAIGLGLYAVSLSMLWTEASLGVAPRGPVAWLTAASLAGITVAYAAIRASVRLRLSSPLINTAQSLYAMVCVIGAYALLGPMRAVTLSILVVVLVFGGFSATRRQLRLMCAATITLLGLTMAHMSRVEPERYPPLEEAVNFVTGGAMLISVAFLAELLSRLRRKLKLRTRELADALARIQDMATHDELTQLANRRQMSQVLADETARRDRSGDPLCVAVIDIDHFKRINDMLGHGAGDTVLRQFAQQAQTCVRRGDVLARWGGEEFLLLLPRTRVDAAQTVLERMRMRGHQSACSQASAAGPVTFSAGVTESPAGEAIELAIERADKAMYRAKRNGRDRVACAALPGQHPAEQPSGYAVGPALT
jgi:diguanylate cyclase